MPGAQPSTVVDIHATDLVETIKFKVKTTITGGQTKTTSNFVIINIICDAISTSISNGASFPLLTSIPQFSTDKHVFDEFTCSVPACCVGSHKLSY